MKNDTKNPVWINTEIFEEQTFGLKEFSVLMSFIELCGRTRKRGTGIYRSFVTQRLFKEEALEAIEALEKRDVIQWINDEIHVTWDGLQLEDPTK